MTATRIATKPIQPLRPFFHPLFFIFFKFLFLLLASFVILVIQFQKWTDDHNFCFVFKIFLFYIYAPFLLVFANFKKYLQKNEPKIGKSIYRVSINFYNRFQLKIVFFIIVAHSKILFWMFMTLHIGRIIYNIITPLML